MIEARLGETAAAVERFHRRNNVRPSTCQSNEARKVSFGMVRGSDGSGELRPSPPFW
jgi:hypothetical protein